MAKLFAGALLALLLAGCESQPASVQPAAPAAEALPTSTPQVPVAGPERRILAFGNSLFAGYNVTPEESYPARLQAALRARGINAEVVNAGVSGDTTQAGRARLAFTLDAQEERPDLFILELGGNDLLRGVPIEQTRANLAAMLAELRRREIPVLLMGMRAPPNLGADYVAQFDAIYPDLAREYGAQLVPFFLQSIYDQPQLIQQDRIHPTAQGIEALVAATVEEVSRALPEEDA
ncbi:arylesterase [Porphyrobacter sp. GA68]|uniref:arylesterase n=1 Tax=Porphyrobacter sp. GA68 TaxID=2883480 RepID=UPI001D19502D|nr:arylesterase [Porphyrobacter sp. GA68]